MNIFNWSNLKIGKKLGFAFAAVLLAFVLSLGVTLIVGRAQVSSASLVANRLTPAELAAINAESALGYADDAGAYYVSERDDARAEHDWLPRYNRFVADVDKYVAAAKTYADTEERKKYIDDFSAAWDKYKTGNSAAFDLRRSHNFEKAAHDFMATPFDASLGNIDAFNKSFQAQIDSETAHGNWLETMAMVVGILLGLVAVGFGVLMAVVITRSIARPLANAVEVASAIAAGDLTQRIGAHGTDETGSLLDAMQQMQERLSRMVSDIRGSVELVYTASREIATGNANLSQRTEEQASSLEETAASMEELTSTVKQNDENARQANQLSIGARDIATKGGEAVTQVVSTMASINDSARKIVDIISVIDGIAFQTNILALNAAVEAARAGEQGRGFAVVAGEVRNLAQRSASAAKEIKALISDSVEKTEAGSRQVDSAGTTMTEIVDSVKRVTDIMSEIAAASKEQLSGIEQVNTAITQMDQATQQNAALVEQAAASAASLEEQASRLVDGVATFRLADDGSTKTKRATARPAAPPPKATEPQLVAASTNGHSKRAGSQAGGDDWETF